jgi:hypothetical protein
MARDHDKGHDNSAPTDDASERDALTLDREIIKDLDAKDVNDAVRGGAANRFCTGEQSNIPTAG